MQRRQKLSVVIAASFTAEPVVETMAFWARKLKWRAQINLAPYNQLFQQLLGANTLLRGNHQGINVVLLRLEDAAMARPGRDASVPKECFAGWERTTQELAECLKTAAQCAGMPWFICLCPPSREALCETEIAGMLARLEKTFTDALGSSPGIFVSQAREIFELYPVADYDAPYANQLAHMPYTTQGYIALGTFVMRKIHALVQPARKVIALDCDGTLWRGVCGEDGAAGVKLNAAHLALQSFVRRRQQQGMLLCLCSKNNAEDVADVFRHRPEMPLRMEDFAAQRVNWLPKSANLRSLARELGLGLDSFIFIDDNGAECAEVEANCPEALALRLPKRETDWPDFLRHVWAFDHLKTTPEDGLRTVMYRQNRRRKELQDASAGLADFLRRLKLEVRTQPAQAEHLSRAAELTRRTNQFHCTGEHFTEGELLRFQERRGEILVASANDRFGDYGLVGVMGYAVSGNALRIEVFLLSCRALGKGVEYLMLARAADSAKRLGLPTVEIRFRRTQRNEPALRFLKSLGGDFREDLDADGLIRLEAARAAAIQFDPAAMSPTPAPETSQEPEKPPSSNFDAPYAWIARFARTPGQVSRLLPAIGPELPATDNHYAAPESNLERDLCGIWEQVLRRSRVGIDDDFFALGGTSQLAVRVLARWEKQTGQQLSLGSFFKAPTIRSFASQIRPPSE